MHKHDRESLLIKTLSEGYTITAACKRAGVSRMFYNRHYKDDGEFRKKVDRAHVLGKQMNDDRVVSALMKKINDYDWRPIKYYLDHNVTPYKEKNSPSQGVAGVSGPRLTSSSGPDAYLQFVRWSAMTSEERVWHGIETQEQFCKIYQVPNTRILEIWSRRPDFKSRITILREDWAFSKTGEVLGSVYAAASNGDHRSQRLWLEHVHHMTEKYDPSKPKRVEVTPDDVRNMIDAMPEEVRRRNHDRLNSIVSDMTEFEESLKRKERQEAATKTDDHLAPFTLPNGEIDWLAYSDTL